MRHYNATMHGPQSCHRVYTCNKGCMLGNVMDVVEFRFLKEKPGWW